MSDPMQDKRNPLAWYDKAHDLMGDPKILQGVVPFVPTVAAALADAYREGTKWKPLLEVKRLPAQSAPGLRYPGQVITVVETGVEELQRQVDELKAALEELGAPVDPDGMCAEFVKCGTFTEEAKKERETISVGKDLWMRVRNERDAALAALQRIANWRKDNMNYYAPQAIAEVEKIAKETLEKP